MGGPKGWYLVGKGANSSIHTVNNGRWHLIFSWWITLKLGIELGIDNIPSKGQNFKKWGTQNDRNAGTQKDSKSHRTQS